jgi:PAS domain S-box-containing protein
MFKQTHTLASRYSIIGAIVVAAMLIGLGIVGDQAYGNAVQPHGYCLLWQPGMVGMFVASDTFIGLSYVAIAVALVYLIRKAGQDIPFNWMGLAFGTFIFACGLTHFMDVWTLYSSNYWLSISVRVITAVASVATAMLLPPLVPKVLRIIQEAKLSNRRKQLLEEEIVERKQTEEKFRALLEAAPDAMVIVDSQGKIVLVNAQTETLFGYPREELLGQNVEILVPEPLRAHHAKHRTGFSGDPHVRPMGVGMELNGRRKDGTLFPVEISLSPLKTEEGLLVTSAIRDITERKRAEEEIRRLNAALEQQIAERNEQLIQLQAVNKELEAFSYSVSHDLRAPVRAMNGFTQILLADYSGQLDNMGRHFLKRLQNSSERMSELIDGLLQLARVSRTDIERTRINLSALAQDIAQELQQTEPERKVEFEIQENITANGDVRLLRALLENLFNNAWKFTRNTANARIEVGEQRQEDHLIYFVRDNGVGFDMKYADKLFTAFQRLHGTDEFEGSGIGLATVERIVHRHGGRVWAEGSVMRGATFYFTLGRT